MIGQAAAIHVVVNGKPPRHEAYAPLLRCPLLPCHPLDLTSAPPLDTVELSGGQDLGAGALAAHRQTHRVAPAAVAAHVAQAGYVLDDAPPQVVLDGQGREAGRQGLSLIHISEPTRPY